MFAVLFESEQEKKRRRMQAIIVETVGAHHLRKLRDLLAFEKLETWRKMNGFDRVVEGEESWFHNHRSLPLTPQEYHASLRLELQKLKDAISVPAENTMTRPWRKTVDFVEGLKGKLPDEELAEIKRYVEKRSREAAKDTVHRCCSPCPLDPEPSSSVYVKLENTEGKMGPELGELELPSAGTGLETPGQQCPPNEGTWNQGRTTTSGILTAGVDSNREGNVFQLRRNAWTRELVPKVQQRLQTPLRQLPPQKTEGARAPPWNTAVTLLSFSGESWEAPCLFSVCTLCFVCALFSKLLFYPGDTSQQAERHEGRRGSSR